MPRECSPDEGRFLGGSLGSADGVGLDSDPLETDSPAARSERVIPPGSCGAIPLAVACLAPAA